MGVIAGRVNFNGAQVAAAVLERMLGDETVSPSSARDIYAGAGVAIAPTWPDAWAPALEGLRIAADVQLSNAAVLRAELQNLGTPFQGSTDHELILHVVRRWGIAGLARLRGAFACAIWNERERQLILARDQIGLRPLYFAVLPGRGVIFASSVRALLRDPNVAREWCPAAIDAYLTLGYVPAPLTAYRRLTKLEPASALVIAGHGLHGERYWDLPAPATARELDALSSLGERLRQSVAGLEAGNTRQGVLYSGGTASTAVLAMTPPAVAPGVLTVTFDHERLDAERADRAVRLLGRAIEFRTAPPDFPALAGALAAAAEEPVADPWAVGQMAIAREARTSLDCALTGCGAAVLWADYARHRIERIEMSLRGWLRGPLASLSAELARALPSSARGARALTHLAVPPADACAAKHAYGLWDDDRRRALYTREFAWQVREHNPFMRHIDLYLARGTADVLDRAIYVDARTFLPDSLLAATHAIAAATGLQLRFPLLDVDVVECAAALPAALKRRGAGGMYALRTLLARELPPALMPPPRRVPARHAWLTTTLRALVPQLLLGPRFDERGIVSRPVLRQIWNEHQTVRRNHAHRLWSLLMLELWFRNAIDGDAADRPFEYAVRTAA